MRLKLNACPYCKGEAAFKKRAVMDSGHNNRHVIYYYAQCLKCGVRTHDMPNRTLAMKSWNGMGVLCR